jgi:hypothetical protein
MALVAATFLTAAHSPGESGFSQDQGLLSLRRIVGWIRVIVDRKAHGTATIKGKLNDDVVGIREEEIRPPGIPVDRDIVLVEMFFPTVDCLRIIEEEADVIKRSAGLRDGRFHELWLLSVGKFEECEDSIRRDGDEVVPLGLRTAHPVRHCDFATEYIPVEGDGFLHVIRDERDVVERAERAGEAVAVCHCEFCGCHGWVLSDSPSPPAPLPILGEG